MSRRSAGKLNESAYHCVAHSVSRRKFLVWANACATTIRGGIFPIAEHAEAAPPLRLLQEPALRLSKGWVSTQLAINGFDLVCSQVASWPKRPPAPETGSHSCANLPPTLRLLRTWIPRPQFVHRRFTRKTFASALQAGPKKTGTASSTLPASSAASSIRSSISRVSSTQPKSTPVSTDRSSPSGPSSGPAKSRP